MPIAIRDLTDEEIAVLELLADAAAAADRLPVLHEADMPELTTAIHAAQNIILARPTFQSYVLGYA